MTPLRKLEVYSNIYSLKKEKTSVKSKFQVGCQNVFTPRSGPKNKYIDDHQCVTKNLRKQANAESPHPYPIYAIHQLFPHTCIHSYIPIIPTTHFYLSSLLHIHR